MVCVYHACMHACAHRPTCMSGKSQKKLLNNILLYNVYMYEIIFCNMCYDDTWSMTKIKLVPHAHTLTCANTWHARTHILR